MAGVTFDNTVGGDGSTVTDDSHPSTGLDNGGFRVRFVPALAQVVAVAVWIKTKALEVLANAQSAQQSKTSAEAAKQGAETARDAALAALQVAAVMEDYGLITEPVTESHDWGTMV